MLRLGLLVGAAMLGISLAQPAAAAMFRLDEVAAGELDPAKATDFADSILFFNIYDTLVTSPPGGGDLQPSLAESWSVDGNTVTFKLRGGVKFHSGNVLTADDVVFSYDRLMALGLGYSHLFKGWVDKVEAVDPATVRFTLSRPYAPFMASLTRLGIVDKATVLANKQPGDFGDNGDYGVAYLSANGAGTGAYMVTGHDPQTVTSLRKFTDHFMGVPAAAPDEGQLKYGLEPATVRTLMSQGEHELSSPYLPPEVLDAMSKTEGIRLVAERTAGGFYFKLNTQRAPLDNKHCRRALALALDYDAVLQIMEIGGTPGGFPAQGPLSPGMLGFSDSTPVSARNLDLARQELAQCPHDMSQNPIEIMWISEVPIEERFALLMQANFAEIGVKSDVVRMPWALFSERAGKADTTPHVNQVVVLPATPDPDSLLYNMYHSGAHGSWMSVEWFSNAKVDELLQAGRTTFDNGERQKIYEELVGVLLDEMPTIFAHQRVHVYAARNDAKVPSLDDPSRLYVLHEMNFKLADVEMQ